MDGHDVLLGQIIAGKTRCVVRGATYYIQSPLPTHTLESLYVYNDALYECSFLDMLTKEDVLSYMIETGLWSNNEEVELAGLPARIDALKVDMYQQHVAFRSKRVEQIRKTLNTSRSRQLELSGRKHKYDYYTTHGVAETARLHYILSLNTYNVNQERVLVEELPESMVRQLLEQYLDSKPGDHELRELSKLGRWRMIWASGRQEGRVFGVPSTHLSEEQQGLIAWSKLYDNIREHPEPPDDEVMGDDDLLDGWLICEQRKKEQKKKEGLGGKQGNKGGSQEVFVMAQTKEDAQRINSMNSPEAAFIKKQRMAVLQKSGAVQEQHLPDSQQRIAVQAAQKLRDNVVNKGRR